MHSFEFYSDGMATPANIIDVVSDQFGVHRATVSMQDRMLVTSGHRRITGRGNAARSSPDSAAALLLAVAATPLSGAAIKETAIHYERYARLLATCNGGGWDSWQVKHLDQLAPGHSLHEAIAAVIVALGAGIAQASDLFVEAAPDTDDILTDLAIDVELEAPRPSAAIFIRAAQWRYHHGGGVRTGDDLTIEQRAIFQDECVSRFESRVEYHQTYEDTVEYLDTLPVHPIVGRRSPDLQQKRVFTIATLAHVAALFSDRVKL